MREADYNAGDRQFSDRAKLVVVSGCPGSGKTTLLEEMGRRGFRVSPDPRRQLIKEELAIGGDGLPWRNIDRFIDLSVSRGMFFYNTALPRPEQPPLAHVRPPPMRETDAQRAHEHVLFDRSLIDSIASFAQRALSTPDRYVAALARYRYANTVFLTPPWPALFVPNQDRQHSFEDALDEYQSLITSFQAHGYELVLIPRLPVAERADFLQVALTRL